MNDYGSDQPRHRSVGPPGFTGGTQSAPAYQQAPAAPQSAPAYQQHAAQPQPTPAYQQHTAQPHAAQPQPAPPYGGPVPVQEQPVPGGPLPGPPSASYGALLAQVMLLVGAALALFTVGALLGGDLAYSTGRTLWLAGVGMLLAQAFIEDLRKGVVGIAFMFGMAFTLGLGFGPVLGYYLGANPDVVVEAALTTLLVVLGTASYGSFTAHDLKSWMRPVSLVLIVAVALSWFLCFAHAPSPPILSAAIGFFSAVAIIVDFNYLRRHATQADVVVLATGIFVSILNIFLSLLRLMND